MRIREYSLNTRYLPKYSLSTRILAIYANTRYLREYSLSTRILAIYPNTRYLLEYSLFTRYLPEYSLFTRYLHEYSLSTRVHAEFESYPPRVHQSYAHFERSILFKLYFLPFLAPLRATISLFLKKQEFNFTKPTVNNQPPPSPSPSTHIPNIHNLQPNFVPFISLPSSLPPSPPLLQALSNLISYPFTS